MTISPAFLDITVQPSYGKQTVLVTWRVMQQYQGGEFFIYRSENGEAPWLPLNPQVDGITRGLRGASSFEDTFTSRDPAAVPHYRLLLRMPNGEEHDSAVVGAYDQLTRGQYAGVYRMLQQDLRRMSKNGVLAWHCIPLTFGEPNPNIDPDTKQQLGVDCPADDDQSFGLPFKGGYAKPTKTYVEFGQRSVQKKDDAGGAGSEDTIVCTARLPAFPVPAVGQLLVQAKTDERWVIDSYAPIQPFLFRGIAAISFDVPLKLLRRSDPRYRLKLPTA